MLCLDDDLVVGIQDDAEAFAAITNLVPVVNSDGDTVYVNPTKVVWIRDAVPVEEPAETPKLELL